MALPRQTLMELYFGSSLETYKEGGMSSTLFLGSTKRGMSPTHLMNLTKEREQLHASRGTQERTDSLTL